MSHPPVEGPKDPDLLSSFAAMRRAAMRAREIARVSGTKLVVVIDGELLHLDPDDPRLDIDAESMPHAEPRPVDRRLPP